MLDPTRLANALKDALLGDPLSQARNNPALNAVCQAIATTVIAEIVANGVVLPTTMLAPPGTAGGPITGTGSIT